MEQDVAGDCRLCKDNQGESEAERPGRPAHWPHGLAIRELGSSGLWLEGQDVGGAPTGQKFETPHERNNGVQLIPEKNTPFSLQPEDSLIVLAEDEL